MSVSDEIVTFEVPPFGRRLSALVPLGLAVAAQGYGLSALLDVDDLHGAELGVWGAIALVWLILFRKAIVFATGLLFGHPPVRRGLFRSTLRVGWRTHRRAQVHAGIVTALTVVALGMARSASAFVLLAGLVALHAVFAWIARSPDLAASQCWGEAPAPAAPAPAPAAPARRERPMQNIKPAPAAVDADPFRAPPRAAVAVQRPRASDAAPRADDPDAPPPSMLL
jgi:hypothetical protein